MAKYICTVCGKEVDINERDLAETIELTPNMPESLVVPKSWTSIIIQPPTADSRPYINGDTPRTRIPIVYRACSYNCAEQALKEARARLQAIYYPGLPAYVD